MDWQYTPYVLPLLIAAAISVSLSFWAWQRRAAPGAKPSILLMLAVAEWSLAYALRLSSTDLAAKIFWSKVRYVGIVIVPTAWLALALQHLRREERLTRRILILLAIEPLVTLLLVWTNEFHHLIWDDISLRVSGSLLVWNVTHGVAFWIHAAYSYLLLLFSTFLLLQILIRSTHLYRGQTAILLLSALTPLVGNVVSTFGLTSFPLDLTPFGFVVAGLLASWGVLHFRFLDIVPVARDAVIEGMSDGVIVLDIQGRIVDLNAAAQQIIGRAANKPIGQLAAQVLPDRLDSIERYLEATEARTEITVRLKPHTGALSQEETQRHYDVRISPLTDHRGDIIGRMLVLHDITVLKQAEALLQAQKELLESLNAVARAVAEQPNLETTLENALSVAATLTDTEFGSLFLLDGAGAVTHSIQALGRARPANLQDRVHRVMDRGLAGWVAQHRQTALVHDTSQDDRWLPLPDAVYTARSALVVPLQSGPELLGILTLTHPTTNHFSAEQAQLLQAAADQMALAVRNARSFDDQRLMADRQATLSKVLTAVGRHLEPQTITNAAVETVARLTGWPAVTVLLPDEAATRLAVHATAGELAVEEDRSLSVTRGVAMRAFTTAQTQYVPQVGADSDHAMGHSSICCELAVPLQHGEQVLGVFYIQSDKPAVFTHDDVLLAESLAEAIALALENARFYAEAHRQATELNALFTVTRMASRSLVLEDVLSRTLSSVMLSLGFEAGLIGLADPVDEQLHLVTEFSLPSILLQQLRHNGMDDTLCAYVHDRRESLFVNGFEGEMPPAISETVARLTGLGLRACACIPLLHKDQSLGAMALFVHQPRSFSSKDKILLDTISHQIAIAVANARLFQAVTDQRGQLQALIESSRDGIIFVGTDQHMLITNAPAHELLQLPGQPQDWVGQPLQEALSALQPHAPGIVQAALAEMHRSQRGDEQPGEGECEIAPRTIHWFNLPVLAGSTPLGRLWILRDVTEERQLEKMRDDLTHTMVHDLRNPLTSLFMALQFLDEPFADNLLPNQRMMLEIALDSSQKLLKMINNILDVSRLESGRMSLKREPIALDDLVAETLHEQSLQARQKGLHLESEIPSTLPLISADASLMERVLQNLVGNAIKFTPSGGEVKVAVETTGELEGSQDGTTPEMRISISDTGSGIPSELQSRLFQKFVTGRQHGSGSGLGLAFCKLTVEAHGGRIWVDSEPDQGTTFIFTLPLV